MDQAIRWRQLGEQKWTPGRLVDGTDAGLYAIQLTDNPKTYLTTDRNGTTRPSPNLGPWEGRYELSTSTPTVKIKPSIVTYVLEIVEA